MPNEKLLLLIAAIATLQPETDFTKSGAPKTDALSAAVGFDITAAERDEAWAEVQKQKTADLPAEETALPEKEDTPVAEPATIKGLDTTGATCVITHRDGPKKVWFRDGKEIGVENV